MRSAVQITNLGDRTSTRIKLRENCRKTACSTGIPNPWRGKVTVRHENRKSRKAGTNEPVLRFVHLQRISELLQQSPEQGGRSVWCLNTVTLLRQANLAFIPLPVLDLADVGSVVGARTAAKRRAIKKANSG